jgi:serine protease Do
VAFHISSKGSNMNARFFTSKRIVIALASAGVVATAGVGVYANAKAVPATPSAPIVTMTAPAVSLPDFSEITARYGPAVVNISVTGMRKTAMDDSPEESGMRRHGLPRVDPNDPFFEFFRRFQGPEFGMPGPQGMPVRAQGSGFIISPDGVILTNAHVVRDAKEVIVKLTDRREFRAKVLGSDPKTDIAVLKIDAKSLPTVSLGSARNLKVGEWVLAIGSPFGFENSVTAGVVSAKGRSLPDDSFVPFIQTDVAVNPGNSGGPLFNTRGEVVGVNAQIYSQTGGYQGLSFAIPIDLATKVKDQIAATGKASHARLGVTIQEVNQTLADSFKLDKPEGALVSSVDKGSAADHAGLRAGDVIRKFSGQPIISSGDLPALVGQAAPGEKVSLEIWREGKREERTATLGDAGDKTTTLATSNESIGQGKLGLALRPLQPQEKQEAGVDGLLIEDAGGPSARAGVQPGDVLIAINGTPAKSVEQVRSLVAKADKSVALLIQRGSDKIFIPVRMG